LPVAFILSKEEARKIDVAAKKLGGNL